MNNAQIANNKFCGPAVVSIIAGIDTDKAEREFQSLRGNGKSIRAAFAHEVLVVLYNLGIRTKQVHFECNHGSMFNLLTCLKEPAMYMVLVTGHFVVVELTADGKRLFCDNHTKTPINAGASARLGMKVVGTWKVG